MLNLIVAALGQALFVAAAAFLISLLAFGFSPAESLWVSVAAMGGMALGLLYTR